ILNDIKCGVNINDNIKLLSIRHNVTKSYLQEIRKKMLHEDDLKYIEDLNGRIWAVLEPVYDNLTDMALEHMHQWYKRVRKASGELDPKLYKYQLDLCYWLLSAIIKNELTDSLYTLLVSRGSGKSFSLSVVASFLALNHETYILHNASTDYVILITAPFEKQLSAFKNYIADLIDVSKGVGIISDSYKVSSEMNLVQTRRNDTEININRDNGAKYSIIYYRLGANSAEGIHSNLALNDESKFLSKQAIQSSLLPTIGGRNGIFVMLSSAHDKWSQYQDYVEQNMQQDIEDNHNKGTKCIMSGSMENGDLCFNGRRLFVQHWTQMIKYNNLYAMTVQRALSAVDNNRNEESFATQYDNRFLAVKTASFFDVKALKENGVTFQHYDAQKYLNNTNYCIIGGVDFSITGDISDFTIKAIPNTWGTNREAILLFKYVMNPSKDKSVDAVVNQLHRIFKYVKLYNISAIIFDETGLGKSSPELFREMLRKENYTRLPESQVYGFEFKAKKRTDLLEFYWGRIQSGKEIMPVIPKDWEDEDKLKRLYMDAVNRIDEKSCYIRHIYEHMMFNRNEYKNDKGEIEIDYRQANFKFLHDDSIFAGGICSYILYLNPNIHSLGEQVIAQKVSTAQMARGRWSRR
ncbi:MAG: hypothetical protein ACRCX2_24095, partial [Paraclostridium sp.]